MPKKETENQQRIITFEGIQYIVLKLGGFGVSRGMNSVNGVDRIKSEIKEANE